MRLDNQHKDFKLRMLGMPVYYGREGIDPHYWKSMCAATAIVMRRHDTRPKGRRTRIGASTGAVWLTRLALEWMPEPYKSEIRAEYLILEQERQAVEAVRAANTPAT